MDYPQANTALSEAIQQIAGDDHAAERQLRALITQTRRLYIRRQLESSMDCGPIPIMGLIEHTTGPIAPDARARLIDDLMARLRQILDC